MKRGDCEFLYSKNVMVCNWMDKYPLDHPSDNYPLIDNYP